MALAIDEAGPSAGHNVDAAALSIVGPYRLIYPVGSRKWNVRAAPHKRAGLLGAYDDGTTVLATLHSNGWISMTLPCGRTGWCKQFDEAHMISNHHCKTGFGWYRVSYVSLHGSGDWGMALETLGPQLYQSLTTESLGGGRCAACNGPLQLGSQAYVGSCGHSFHYECLKGLGDANICTACGVWTAIGQQPPTSNPEPSQTTIFQHVHQILWWVPPFYRYGLIYAMMILAVPFLVIASALGLLPA